MATTKSLSSSRRMNASGRIVVSVNRLVGVYEPEEYKWLRENFEPVDSIAYSYLIYDVSFEDLKKISEK